jgi:lipopolysaccharide/colanic/teichoic acid biosynthesis glycosyltransferase
MELTDPQMPDPAPTPASKSAVRPGREGLSLVRTVLQPSGPLEPPRRSDADVQPLRELRPVRPAIRVRLQRVLGRAMDVVVSATVLLLLLPLLLALVLWIRLDSPGPALYRQERVGLGRRPFCLYKFRSMRVGGDDAAHRALVAAELRGEDTRRNGSTKVADPRVTPVGRLLRRTSIDEVPQLINVLLGHMALVGPRPCLAWEAEMFPAEYAERFEVRPGLTGLWQVRGRSTVGTLAMLKMDVEYVRTKCFWGDVAILFWTVPALFRGDGAR